MGEDLKADKTEWISATERLMKRRLKDGILKKATEPHYLYEKYITMCGYGNSVLDVGCGSQTLRLSLPKHVSYIGLDAFPIKGVDCIQTPIEELEGVEVDTCFAFAILDNCIDFYKACDSMKKAAKVNIGIVTGIGIEVDEYHTFKLEHEHFNEAFKDWDCTLKQQLSKIPNVWILNYKRK